MLASAAALRATTRRLFPSGDAVPAIHKPSVARTPRSNATAASRWVPADRLGADVPKRRGGAGRFWRTAEMLSSKPASSQNGGESVISQQNISAATPMGATLVAGGGATFRVWAPRATSVYL